MKKIVKNGYEFAKKTIKLAHLSRASFCSLYFSYIYQEPSEVGYNGFLIQITVMSRSLLKEPVSLVINKCALSVLAT